MYMRAVLGQEFEDVNTQKDDYGTTLDPQNLNLLIYNVNIF